MMIYVYLRVSTDKQDCDNQKQGVLKWLEYKGWNADEWLVEEGVSGKIDYRKRLLGKLLDKTMAGDWVIVSELSRLSRSMVNTFELVKELSRKGVNVFCVKENIQIADDALGLMILSSFAFAAQIERERISQRTKEALGRVKATGKHLGRPFGFSFAMLSLDNTRDYIIQCLENGEGLKSLSKKLNVSVTTFRRWLEKEGLMTYRQEKWRKKFPNGNDFGRKKELLCLPYYNQEAIDA